MAVPRGPKQRDHGMRVYSQTANAIRLRKLKGIGEFAADAAADTSPPLTVETPPESLTSPEGLSTESIGVATTVRVPEPVAAPEDDAPIYHCNNCQERPIKEGTPECPTCEEPLNWSGLT